MFGEPIDLSQENISMIIGHLKMILSKGQEQLGLTSTHHPYTLQMETATADDTSYNYFLTILGGLKPMSYTTYHSKKGAS